MVLHQEYALHIFTAERHTIGTLWELYRVTIPRYTLDSSTTYISVGIRRGVMEAYSWPEAPVQVMIRWCWILGANQVVKLLMQ